MPEFRRSPRFNERPRLEWATTLNELLAASGKHAAAVEADTCWTAILRWLERDWDKTRLTNGCDLSYQVATIMRDDDRVRLSFPNRNRKPWSTLLPRFSPQTQADFATVRAEIIADWDRAGRPGLGTSLIKSQHKYVRQALERNRR